MSESGRHGQMRAVRSKLAEAMNRPSWLNLTWRISPPFRIRATRLPVSISQTRKCPSAEPVATLPARAAGPERKTRLNVGTLGGVDDAKTVLTAAITQRQATKGLARFVPLDEIERPPQVRAWGLSIAAARVGYETETRSYSHVDIPTQADYLKGLLAAPI